ncbi:MAG: hypothetical protein WCS37_08890 [Chloroflexota bacterium]|nr:hypothetical protein [Chloroflexota bacterium]
MTEMNRSTNPLFFLFYFLVHLIFCTSYTGLLVLYGGQVGLMVLLGVVLVSSGWAARRIWQFRQHKTGGIPVPSPLVVLLFCLAGWFVTFPIYLTYRQWLRRRIGLKTSHFSKHS